VFNRATAKFGAKWWCFHRLAWLQKESYAEKPLDELRDELTEKLAAFVRDDLPQLEATLDPIADLFAKDMPV
jgi:hypothetical protein